MKSYFSNKQFVILSLFIALTVGAPAAFAQDGISGLWLTEKRTEVRIKPCVVGHCGFVAKVVVPPEVYKKNKQEIDQIGEENLFDYFNKDPSLRTRPLLGLQILTLNTRETAQKFTGEIYNAEDGNTYTGSLEVIDANNIRLTGCGFFNLLCKSEKWVRIGRN